MKIFIDAMGGDRAPDSVIAGVQLIAKEARAELILLGDSSILNPLIHKSGLSHLSVIHCPEVITMKDQAVQAIKAKKNSSIVQGLQLAASTPNSAFFSAGHSGAVFAAALLEMGRLHDIERPAIATILPSLHGHLILLDAGANVDCRATHLAQFAQMGSIYAQVYLKHSRPTVGILSNGEEDSKGTELTRSAHTILKTNFGEQSKFMNYIGYIEGKEMFSGKVDVVVTDGFTGNLVLKSLEGFSKTILTLIKQETKKGIFSRIGALFSLPLFAGLQKKIDYAEVGSAPLLGVDGNCFIGHGRSSPKAIKNGILRAQEAIELKLHEKLNEQFGKLK